MNKSYSFLEELREKEREVMEMEMRKTKSSQRKEKLKSVLEKMVRQTGTLM